ncbi:MAG: cytochrome c-type biogenesis protein CcmH [Gemmatimonadetes bacterium]|nr:cytochrome c-type biogenesis protein CcmH [Gemmatimonadota bacterium]
MGGSVPVRRGARLSALACMAVVAGSALGQQPVPQPGAAAAGVEGGRVVGRATDTVLERRTTEIARGLRCPVCQGESIQDSPAELAVEMRGLVREQLAAGRSAEEINQYFVARYGEWILLSPKPVGFNLFAYIVPVVALIAGSLVVGLSVRRWTRGAPTSPGPSEDA